MERARWLKRQLSVGFQLGLGRLIGFRSPGFHLKSASFQSIGVGEPAAAEFWRGRYSLMGSRRMAFCFCSWSLLVNGVLLLRYCLLSK
ncbi:hypothetical protein WN943_025796 [Citrus x changshan-huyou]